MSINFAAALPGGPVLNVANGNAARLFELLGLGEEWDGEVPAEDFLGRCLLAHALLDIAGDEQGRPDVHDGRFVECGYPPGYLAGRLVELHGIAEWAHHHHVPVVWG
jgi:hypothetical protein